MTLSIILLEASIRWWVQCGQNGLEQHSGRLWYLKDAQVVLRGCKRNTKDGSMHLYYVHQIFTLLSECCSRSDSRKATFFQPSFVPFWWTCVNFSISFLFLASRSGPQCGVQLLQPICFTVWCVLHLTLDVTSGDLSFCCLPISSKHSDLFYFFFFIILCKS